MLLDLMMPRVDGYTVIERVREQKIDIEIVIVTAAGASQVHAIDRSLVRSVISKPFDVTQLVDVVTRVCDGVKVRHPDIVPDTVQNRMRDVRT